MLAVRGVAWQEEKIVDGNGTLPFRSFSMHDGIESDEGDREVGGMGGDALLAGTQDRVAPVDALQRGAAAARLAFVARGVRVPEVTTADPLQEVAPHRGHVAQLRRGAQDKGLSDHREALCHSGRLGNIAHPCERSDAQATIGKLFDLLERQQIDVNETAGLYDIQAQ